MPLFFIYHVIRFDLSRNVELESSMYYALPAKYIVILVLRNHSNLVTEQFMQLDKMYDSIYHRPWVQKVVPIGYQPKERIFS